MSGDARKGGMDTAWEQAWQSVGVAIATVCRIAMRAVEAEHYNEELIQQNRNLKAVLRDIMDVEGRGFSITLHKFESGNETIVFCAPAAKDEQEFVRMIAREMSHGEAGEFIRSLAARLKAFGVEREQSKVRGHGGKRVGAGRPESAAAMTARVLIRMSEDEREWLRARAEADGTTEAGLIRRLIAAEREC